MGELSDAFGQGILATGMQRLEHPVFYLAPLGIRFEIGGEEPIYGSTKINNLNVNPAYVTAAFNRASAVYSALPAPSEQVLETRNADENENACIHLYWDLLKFVFCRNKLLQEIIRADLCGCSELTSSVYFLHSHNAVLYHLHDDRGLDVITADKEAISKLFTIQPKQVTK